LFNVFRTYGAKKQSVPSLERIQDFVTQLSVIRQDHSFAGPFRRIDASSTGEQMLGVKFTGLEIPAWGLSRVSPFQFPQMQKGFLKDIFFAFLTARQSAYHVLQAAIKTFVLKYHFLTPLEHPQMKTHLL
jgi:hypothetical protein